MRAATTQVINYLNAARAAPDAQTIFTLRTGLILTYTDADAPIVLNGYTYLDTLF